MLWGATLLRAFLRRNTIVVIPPSKILNAQDNCTNWSNKNGRKIRCCQISSFIRNERIFIQRVKLIETLSYIQQYKLKLYHELYVNRQSRKYFLRVTMNDYIGNEKIRGILCKSGKASFTKLGYQNPIDETRLPGVFANQYSPHPFVACTVYHMSDNGQIMPLRPR